jgi:hypothetical protein
MKRVFSGLSLMEVMKNYRDLYGHENPILEKVWKDPNWSDGIGP